MSALRRVLVAAVAALALCAAPRHACAEAARHARTASRGKWRVRLGVSERHDSNVLDLSARDRGQVRDPAHADKYHLRSADDWLTLPDIELSWRKDLLRRRTTELALRLDPALYARNGFLDREALTLSVDQELGRDRRPTMSRIGVELVRVPRTTLRRLVDDDVSLLSGMTVRADDFYAMERVRMSGTAELWPKRLALDLGADRERRVHRATFDERSGPISGWDARLAGYPTEHVRLRAGFRSERLDAHGDDAATPFVEDDISSKRRIAYGDVRLSWGKPASAQRAWVGFERERRDYGATSPFDFYHHGRRDARQAWSLGWRRELPHDLAVEVAVRDDANVTSFREPPPTSNPADEATTYDTTAVTAGVSWKLDLGGRRVRARSLKGTR